MLESSISGLSAAGRRARHVFPAALALVSIPLVDPSNRAPGHLIWGEGGVLVCPKDGTLAEVLSGATLWYCEDCDMEYDVEPKEPRPPA